MGFNRERGLPHVPTVHVTRMRTSQRGRFHFMGCVRVRNCHLLCHSKVLRSAPFLQFSQATHLPTPLALSFSFPPCFCFATLCWLPLLSMHCVLFAVCFLTEYQYNTGCWACSILSLATGTTYKSTTYCSLWSHSHLTPLYIYEGATSALSTLSITQSPYPLYIHEGATSALLLFWCTLLPSVYEGATSALSTLLLHPVLLEATGWMYLAICTHPTPHKAKPSLCLSLIWEWSS